MSPPIPGTTVPLNRASPGNPSPLPMNFTVVVPALPTRFSIPVAYTQLYPGRGPLPKIGSNSGLLAYTVTKFVDLSGEASTVTYKSPSIPEKSSVSPPKIPNGSGSSATAAIPQIPSNLYVSPPVIPRIPCAPSPPTTDCTRVSATPRIFSPVLPPSFPDWYASYNVETIEYTSGPLTVNSFPPQPESIPDTRSHKAFFAVSAFSPVKAPNGSWDIFLTSWIVSADGIMSVPTTRLIPAPYTTLSIFSK